MTTAECVVELNSELAAHGIIDPDGFLNTSELTSNPNGPRLTDTEVLTKRFTDEIRRGRQEIYRRLLQGWSAKPEVAKFSPRIICRIEVSAGEVTRAEIGKLYDEKYNVPHPLTGGKFLPGRMKGMAKSLAEALRALDGDVLWSNGLYGPNVLRIPSRSDLSRPPAPEPSPLARAIIANPSKKFTLVDRIAEVGERYRASGLPVTISNARSLEEHVRHHAIPRIIVLDWDGKKETRKIYKTEVLPMLFNARQDAIVILFVSGPLTKQNTLAEFSKECSEYSIQHIGKSANGRSNLWAQVELN